MNLDPRDRIATALAWLVISAVILLAVRLCAHGAPDRRPALHLAPSSTLRPSTGPEAESAFPAIDDAELASPGQTWADYEASQGKLAKGDGR